LDIEQEVGGLTDAAAEAGAIVTFVGLVRPSSTSGGSVDHLILEHHPLLTQQSLDEIIAAAVEKFAVTAIRVTHRSGTMSVGEPIVFAGAAAAHRREAFNAVDFLMDRLKTDAVFWKREEGPEGSRWIEPTDADHVAGERW
jgi:molybdopterin synthase catalytic subunit